MLQTTENQFGFKSNSSTDLCVFSLKQVIDYYRNNGSPVYHSRPRYPSLSILYLCPIFIIIYYCIPPFEFATLSQKLAIASLSNFLGILRTSVRSSDRNFSWI